MKGKGSVFTARNNRMLHPEPLTESWAKDCSDWPGLGTMAAPTTQGAGLASPVSMNDSRRGLVPPKKTGECDQR